MLNRILYYSFIAVVIFSGCETGQKYVRYTEINEPKYDYKHIKKIYIIYANPRKYSREAVSALAEALIKNGAFRVIGYEQATRNDLKIKPGDRKNENRIYGNLTRLGKIKGADAVIVIYNTYTDLKIKNGFIKEKGTGSEYSHTDVYGRMHFIRKDTTTHIPVKYYYHYFTLNIKVLSSSGKQLYQDTSRWYALKTIKTGQSETKRQQKTDYYLEAMKISVREAVKLISPYKSVRRAIVHDGSKYVPTAADIAVDKRLSILT